VPILENLLEINIGGLFFYIFKVGILIIPINFATCLFEKIQIKL